MTEYAPNWDQNQVLTWSGKWHVRSEVNGRTQCAADAIYRDDWACTRGHLQAIATGRVEAPLCKRCARHLPKATS